MDSRIKARIVKKLAKDSRILEIESWLFEPRKEIRLEVYRHSAAMKSAILAQKPNPYP